MQRKAQQLIELIIVLKQKFNKQINNKTIEEKSLLTRKYTKSDFVNK